MVMNERTFITTRLTMAYNELVWYNNLLLLEKYSLVFETDKLGSDQVL